MKNVLYRVNGTITTKSSAEWFFGKTFVSNLTASAQREHQTSGETTFKYWQDGTGFLTIEIHQ